MVPYPPSGTGRYLLPALSFVKWPVFIQMASERQRLQSVPGQSGPAPVFAGSACPLWLVNLRSELAKENIIWRSKVMTVALSSLKTINYQCQ